MNDVATPPATDDVRLAVDSLHPWLGLDSYTEETRAYSERLGNLAGHTLTIAKVVSRPNGVWIVDSSFSHPSSLPIKLEWEVRDTGHGPRIADVRILGVSMLLTKRSEFNSYIMSNGGTFFIFPQL